MDSSVQIALIGGLTTFITTVSVIAVAVLNSKKERADTADNAVEATLRERLVLRDEQIVHLRAELANLRAAAKHKGKVNGPA